jgi:hypothetical protein
MTLMKQILMCRILMILHKILLFISNLKMIQPRYNALEHYWVQQMGEEGWGGQEISSWCGVSILPKDAEFSIQKRVCFQSLPFLLFSFHPL